MADNSVPTTPIEGFSPTRWTAIVALAALSGTLLLGCLLGAPSRAYADEAPVGLGTAAAYSVLGGQTVTNIGPSTLNRNLGVSPGTAITGFPPGTVGGATHAGDAPAAQAQSDLVIAYDDAAGRAPTGLVAGDLVGKTLVSGVYKSTSSLALSGTVTLDGQGNKDAVFIFQIASTLITASASTVAVINGAQACNIYWQVGSSATLGTDSAFKGTVMALTSIAVATDTVIDGRMLARNGEVTLDSNTFHGPGCETGPPTTTTTTTTAPTTTTDLTTTTTPTTTTTTTTTTPTTTTTTDLTTTTSPTTTATTPITTTDLTSTIPPATSTPTTELPNTTTPILTTTATTSSGAGGSGTGGSNGGPGNDTGPVDSSWSQTDLASTGSPVALLLALGALLVLLGGALLAVRRSRSH